MPYISDEEALAILDSIPKGITPCMPQAAVPDPVAFGLKHAHTPSLCTWCEKPVWLVAENQRKVADGDRPVCFKCLEEAGVIPRRDEVPIPKENPWRS